MTGVASLCLAALTFYMAHAQLLDEQAFDVNLLFNDAEAARCHSFCARCQNPGGAVWGGDIFSSKARSPWTLVRGVAG